MRITRFALAFIVLTGLAACGGSDSPNDPPPEPPKPAYPETRSGTDSDVYFGHAVADPYRWLEDIESTETDTWVNAQTHLAATHIAALPDYGVLSKRIAKWFAPAPSSASLKRRDVQQKEQLHVEGVQGKDGKYYYQIQERQQQHRFFWPAPTTDFLSVDNAIYVADSAADAENGTLLVDANAFRIDPDDHIQLMNHQVSKDGKHLVYAMVRNYADLAELHVIDLQQPEYGPVLQIPNVFGGAFMLHEQGLFYSTPRHTANPHVSPHTYQTLYHQSFYEQTAQAWVHGEQFDQVTPGPIHEGYLYYNLTTGKRNSVGRISLAQPEQGGELVFDSGASGGLFGVLGDSEEDPGKLLVVTTQGAALYRLIEADPDSPEPQNWREILPNSPPGVTEYVDAIHRCGNDYYAEHLVQGSSRLFHYNNGNRREIALPGEGSIRELACLESNGQTLLSYGFSSLIQPYTQYTYNPETHAVTQGASRHYEGYDPGQYETRRLTVTSADGTQFPLYIAHKKGLKPTGDIPTLMYVYGGFSVAIKPSFQEKPIPLLESGGIYAVAQVRGGSEFGMDWHDAGRLFNKQNTYDDIAAAATHLVDAGLTQPAKLALQGESNGGLSTAVMGLQRPDLFAVVFPTVGVLDLVRYDRFTSGFGWHDDYGQVTRQAEFENLMKFSPLHNVQPKPYLPTYVFTGKTDGRVMPAHSYKYAATLQNTATGNHPYMLYAFPKDGHSLNSNWQYYLTYMWTAFFHHTGSRYNR